MAAMASKFNFECVIQYYTDQWILPGVIVPVFIEFTGLQWFKIASKDVI